MAELIRQDKDSRVIFEQLTKEGARHSLISVKGMVYWIRHPFSHIQGTAKVVKFDVGDTKENVKGVNVNQT